MWVWYTPAVFAFCFHGLEGFKHAHADDTDKQGHDHPRGEDDVHAEEDEGHHGLGLVHVALEALEVPRHRVDDARVLLAPVAVRVAQEVLAAVPGVMHVAIEVMKCEKRTMNEKEHEKGK